MKSSVGKKGQCIFVNIFEQMNYNIPGSKIMTLEEEYELSCYKELTELCDGKESYIVKNINDGKIYVKKKVKLFNRELLLRLMELDIKDIPKIYLCIEDGEELTVIEEYIHGETLYEYQKKNGLFNEREAVEIICRLCDILSQLHSFDPPIIHRDIKPMNVMISNDEVVKLIDFDAARENIAGEVEDTYLMGTKEFAAPEQYGFGQSDARTDIYALGIMLNVMLTGEVPKNRIYGNDLKTLTKIIKKCIMLEPDKRYKNVNELKRNLQFLYLQNYIPNINKPYIHLSKTNYLRNDKNLIDELRTYLPVGYRTGKLWKMIIATISYIVIAMVSFGLVMEDSHTGETYTNGKLYLLRTFIFVIIIGSITYLGNYRGVRYKLPGTRQKGLLNIIMSLVYVISYSLGLFVIMALLII